MTINCKGQLIDVSTPKVMGILNVTPNSFFDGGKYKNENEILSQVEKMLIDGATFIDLGAYSSKPSAEFVSEQEEISRIIPAIDLILKHFPETILSIDTFRSEVAKASIENGAAIINDIAAGNLDDKMFEVIAKYNVPYIMMHMRGNPQTMQKLTNYEDIVKEMLFYFSELIAKARSFGINDLIIDPGFGFAKTIEQNYEVFQKMELFKMLELPLLIGISRKSMIYKSLNTNVEKALNGTTVLNTLALTKGAKILRVHDVKEAMECVTLFNKINL
ncbi:dihydropteroate synthase [Flavobacterium gawalongense]|uniref:Dihydropteroate synthase n=1 Tax=Flavobacterium gawalongense TaxID=2594432 RepID=A0A553BSU4_9FLAO|nr:dihydropteroate synthase [Flavobacterium gawalongense]TRX03660.1 dihydropteroate synthase [Flavobacterium gawalongense]TRX08807.1 dihydropteroate synthase [Flavobacterium gawalongense]TRX11314.1 dihydropteroate synthase [Flavobacterium gawalongense]TRX12225.1 dihydropteroate synthase [Flavobacterium gawalongense]TRX30236.1 dihydropteroate synthase [Flavobacterium gawalongense]